MTFETPRIDVFKISQHQKVDEDTQPTVSRARKLMSDLRMENRFTAFLRWGVMCYRGGRAIVHQKLLPPRSVSQHHGKLSD